MHIFSGARDTPDRKRQEGPRPPPSQQQQQYITPEGHQPHQPESSRINLKRGSVYNENCSSENSMPQNADNKSIGEVGK